MTGQPDKRFITSPTGELLALEKNGALYYYLFDGSGSVVGLFGYQDYQWQQVNSYSYEPFGQTSPTEYVSQPYRFHGGYHDSSDTDFYKMGARYYDFLTGRFTQPEPAWSNPMFNTMGGRSLLVRRSYGTGAGVGQGNIPAGYYRPGSDYNWYSYAASDPANGTDITGYRHNAILGGIAIGVGIPLGLAGGLLTLGLVVPALGVGELPLAVTIPMTTVGVSLTVWGIEQLLDVSIPLPPNWPFFP
ncbi:MAG: hypothetical protein HYY29_02840 [Chloroflexi bacterium]|nr:hypothetical protein [Chloroflexota bacterium]